MESGQGRPRDVRAAENESSFRAINEQLLGAVGTLENRRALREIVCECPRLACNELISLSAEEYESVRQDGERFVIAPGEEHVFGQVERVVVKRDRFWVVEKVGIAGDVAEELDPRDPD